MVQMNNRIEYERYIYDDCPRCGIWGRIYKQSNPKMVCSACQELNDAVSTAIRDTKLSIARELNDYRWAYMKKRNCGIYHFMTAKTIDPYIDRLVLEAMGWEGI